MCINNHNSVMKGRAVCINNHNSVMKGRAVY